MQRRMITVVPRQWVIAVLVAVVSSITMGIISIQYANYGIAKSDRENARLLRQLCGIVIISDDAYKRTPPLTETGRLLAAEMAKLRKEYGC